MKQTRERRTFSSEFKQEILDKIDRGELTVSEAGRTHELSVTQICRWRRECRESELDLAVEQAPKLQQLGVDPKYVRGLEWKLREANERLGELYIVVEGLKKIHGEKPMKSANSFVVTGSNWDQSRGRVK